MDQWIAIDKKFLEELVVLLLLVLTAVQLVAQEGLQHITEPHHLEELEVVGRLTFQEERVVLLLIHLDILMLVMVAVVCLPLLIEEVGTVLL